MTQTAVPAVPAAGSMRDRVPAQALLEQVLLRQAVARPRTRLDRILGRDPIEPGARPWYAGAKGERAVAATLSTLPAGWSVLHSLPVGRNVDIDHLVVGPGGVFTVTTKHYIDVSTWVAGRTVLVAGPPRPLMQKAEAEARRVDHIVASVLADPPATRPVVAVVGAKHLTVPGPPRSVTVLRVEHLRRLLRGQPERLTPAEVHALVIAFEDPSTWLPTREAGPELLLAFSRLSDDVRRAARVRTGWAFGLLAMTAAASSAIVLPGLLAVFSS